MFKPKPVEPLALPLEVAQFDKSAPPQAYERPRLHPQQQYLHVFNPSDWRASKRGSKK